MIPHAAPHVWVRGAGLRFMRVLPLLLAFLWASGCAPANREELVKEVLKTDPEFSSVLDKHQQLASRIETLQKELELKRTTIQQSIKQLQKELATAAEHVKLKTADVKKRMEPDRQRLGLALSMAVNELREKREQRAQLGRSLAELKKASKNPHAEWTEKERTHHERQMDEMLQDAKRFDQEMAQLKEHLRLLKIKLLLIKL